MKKPAKNTNEADVPGIDDLDLSVHEDDLDLFSEELEDRFNADGGSTFSTASTAGSCFTTASSLCCFLASAS